MKILEHLPKKRLSIGGNFEHSLSGAGCFGACSLGCLTPLLLGGGLLALRVHEPSSVSWWIWGCLTVVGMYVGHAMGRPDGSCSGLVADRSAGTFRWSEWIGRSRTRTHEMPLDAVEAMEIEADRVHHGEFRRDVEIEIFAREIPAGVSSSPPKLMIAVFAFVATVFFRLPLPRWRKRGDDEVGDSPEGERSLPHHELDSVELDLELDGATDDDVLGVGRDLARVMGLRGHELQEEGDTRRHVFRKAGGPIPAQDDRDAPFTSIAVEEDAEAWKPIDGAIRSDQELSLRNENWLTNLGCVGMLVLVFGGVIPWRADGEVLSVVRDVMVGTLIAVLLSGLVHSIFDGKIRRIRVCKQRKMIELRRLAGRTEVPFGDVDRVLFFAADDPELIVDTRAGSIEVDLDVEKSAEKDPPELFRKAAGDLAALLGVPAVEFRWPPDQETAEDESEPDEAAPQH